MGLEVVRADAAISLHLGRVGERPFALSSCLSPPHVFLNSKLSFGHLYRIGWMLLTVTANM